MTQLTAAAKAGQLIDINSMYTRTTVDITTELAFGTSFDTLKSERFREWMGMQARTGFFLVLARWMKRYPITQPIIKAAVPKKFVEHMKINRQHVNRVVAERLQQGVMEEKRDFTSCVLKNRGNGKGVMDGELADTARTLILAGAETTRMVLTVTTYWLLHAPHALARITKEVRDAFDREEDINFLRVTAESPYMLACFDEAMRLRPSLPSVLSGRITPSTASMSIVGYEVPPNVRSKLSNRCCMMLMLIVYRHSYLHTLWL